MLNGVTQVIMTKADVLDSFEELNVCTGYNINGAQTDKVPFQLMQTEVVPQYKHFDGWKCDSTCIKNNEKLPESMQRYINFINQYTGAPVKYVSNGPQRDQIIKV